MIALLVVALGEAVIARPRWNFMPPVSAALFGLGAILAFARLLGDPAPALLAVPVGLPGHDIVLALDGLSAFFLLIVYASATAAMVYAWHDQTRTAPAMPAFIAAMALTLLAGDAFSLVLGFELMSLASWVLVLTHHEAEDTRGAALLYLGMAAFGAACLIPAFALLAPLDSRHVDVMRFDVMRLVPPDGWRASAVLVLTLLGAGSKAGLAPLHVWLPRAHPAAPSHVSAVMSGAMTKVAVYVLIRVLFDLCGTAQPVWWAVPLLLAGSAAAVLGALRATQEADTKAVLAASTIENIGLITIGLGVALAARASDLAPLASLALAGALLHALAHGLFKTLLFLGAGAVQHGAGTRRLDRLGGLIHRMPVTTACVLVGAAALAAVPPMAGFASEWVLFQSVLAAARVGGMALQTVVAMVAAMMALAVALAAAAAVRLVGVAFLGRPRTPRCAAADEAPPEARVAMIGLAVLVLLVGLLPGPVLALADPALRLLTSVGLRDRAGPFAIATQIDVPGYAAPAIALLLALAGLALWLLAKYRMAAGERRAAAWDCGFAPPPAWLPFGDPATQYGGAAFAEPLGRSLGGTLLALEERVDMPAPADTRPAGYALTWRDPAEALLFTPLLRLREAASDRADRMQFLTVRRTLSVMFALLVLLLAIVAWVES